MRIPGAKAARQARRWVVSRLTGGAVILGYHRVASVKDNSLALCVSPRNFEAHLEALQRIARPMALQALVHNVRGGIVNKRAVVVTFDDAYQDVLCQASPLLKMYKIPTTIFAVSGYLGAQFPWDEQPGNGARDGSARAMTGEELAQLAEDPLFDIGAHSVSHPALAALSAEDQQVEVEKSKAALEALLSLRISGFSYPHGSASPLTRAIVRQAGYEYGCASFNDVARPANDLYYLPRFWPGDWDGPRFERWLKWWLVS